MTTLMLIGCAALMAAGDDPFIELNSTRQLFLDDAVVDSLQNIQRTVHPAAKFDSNPVLWPSESWEGPVAVIYGSVLRDDGTYRM